MKPNDGRVLAEQGRPRQFSSQPAPLKRRREDRESSRCGRFGHRRSVEDELRHLWSAVRRQDWLVEENQSLRREMRYLRDDVAALREELAAVKASLADGEGGRPGSKAGSESSNPDGLSPEIEIGVGDGPPVVPASEPVGHPKESLKDSLIRLLFGEVSEEEDEDDKVGGSSDPQHPPPELSLGQANFNMTSGGSSDPQHPPPELSLDQANFNMTSGGSSDPQHPPPDQSLGQANFNMTSGGSSDPQHPPPDQSLGQANFNMTSGGSPDPHHPPPDQAAVEANGNTATAEEEEEDYVNPIQEILNLKSRGARIGACECWKELPDEELLPRMRAGGILCLLFWLREDMESFKGPDQVDDVKLRLYLIKGIGSLLKVSYRICIIRR